MRGKSPSLLSVAFNAARRIGPRRVVESATADPDAATAIEGHANTIVKAYAELEISAVFHKRRASA